VPRPGEFGHDTWEGDSWTYTGNISTWTPLAASSELGLVFCDTDCPTNDYAGADRLGDNLFANSMIALDVKTGKRAWHFQMVHHDVWNYDSPVAPTVFHANINGERKLIVTQSTKQGFVYTWDAETGEPIWPIEERPVPQSDVPGERLSPTQPFPTKPPPFEQQGVSEENLIDFTPELRAAALKIASNFRMGPLFNPPSLPNAPDGTNGALIQPGASGGAVINGGPAADPETGFLYEATISGAGVLALVPGAERKARPAGPSNSTWVRGGGGGSRVQGLPLSKPPYGSIVAYDMNEGDIAWRIPNGETPDNIKNSPALKGVDIPNTGIRSHATILVTKTLLLYGEGRSGQPRLHAVDKATGKELGTVELPGPTSTPGMTYMHEGRQYLALPVSGRGVDPEVVALALPEE